MVIQFVLYEGILKFIKLSLIGNNKDFRIIKIVPSQLKQHICLLQKSIRNKVANGEIVISILVYNYNIKSLLISLIEIIFR